MVCSCFVVNAFVVIVLSRETRQNQGRKLVDRKLFKAPPPHPTPCNFIADRPKAALLVWFVGDFRCGVFLFMLIFVLYKYKNR